MISKNKRRVIVIDGDEWEYCVSGFVSVFAKNLRTGEVVRWHQEWKPKWKQCLGPRAIRAIIRGGVPCEASKRGRKVGRKQVEVRRLMALGRLYCPFFRKGVGEGD